MKLKRYVTPVLLLLFVINLANAQLQIDGEFRTRGMVDHGFMDPVLENTAATFSVDQRTRLNVGYQAPKFSTYISLQDARVWGGDDLISKAGAWGNSTSFGVHQAWVNLKIKEHSNLKIGRQEWNYDNMRILSFRNWLTPALSYDGLLYQTRNKEKGLQLDLGLSYNNNGSPMGYANNTMWQVEKLKSLNFLHLQKSFTPRTSIALLFTLSARKDTTSNTTLGTGTHGLVFNHNKGKTGIDGLFASFEGYYQHGKDIKRGSDSEYKNISAYLLAADLGVRTLQKRLELSIGGELVSGHDYTNTDSDYNNTRHSFDFLYGARFPYYGGYMNHFIIQESYVLGTKSGGYFDPYFKSKFAINKKNILEASFYAPILTTDVKAHTAIDKAAKKPIGSELDNNGNPVYWKGSMGQYIDLVYTHKASKEISIKTGVSYGFLSDIKNQMVFGYADPATKELNQLGQNYFGWVMLSVKPNFFTSK